MGKNQHVVKHKDGWAVKGAGNEKATKVTRTQKDANEAAIKIAKIKKVKSLFTEEMVEFVKKILTERIYIHLKAEIC